MRSLCRHQQLRHQSRRCQDQASLATDVEGPTMDLMIVNFEMLNAIYAISRDTLPQFC